MFSDVSVNVTGELDCYLEFDTSQNQRICYDDICIDGINYAEKVINNQDK